VTLLAWQVFGIALLTDLATGLGALPFAFKRALSARWQGISYAIAGGMMVSASVFSLAEQGLRRGNVWEIVAGMLAGAGFFWLTAKQLEHNDWKIENLSAKDSKQAVLIVTTMFIHSIPEGIAVGVGYATGDLRFGLLLALAIAVPQHPGRHRHLAATQEQRCLDVEVCTVGDFHQLAPAYFRRAGISTGVRLPTTAAIWTRLRRWRNDFSRCRRVDARQPGELFEIGDGVGIHGGAGVDAFANVRTWIMIGQSHSVVYWVFRGKVQLGKFSY
jgi:hypothetical protein